MKGRLLAWFLFISCTHALAILALESSSNLQDQVFDPSEPIIMQGIKVGAVNETIGLYPEGNGREYKKKRTRFESRKGQKGKGSNGGSNVDHRPSNEKSSAVSLLARRPKSSLFIPVITFILLVSSTLFLAFPFHHSLYDVLDGHE